MPIVGLLRLVIRPSEAPIPKPLNIRNKSESLASTKYSAPNPSKPTDTTVSPLTEPLKNATENAASFRRLQTLD